MTISDRANQYLQKQKYRADAIQSIDLLKECFDKNSLELTPALLNFQLKYGGLLIYAGLEPICFGIVHGDLVRGLEFNKPHQIISFTEKDLNPINHYVCADTLYQELFSIDEKGNYYEGSKLMATNFDYVIEDLAILDELNERRFKQIIGKKIESETLDLESIIIDFKLDENIVDLVKWYSNNEVAIRITKFELKVYSTTMEVEKLKRSFQAKLGRNIINNQTKNVDNAKPTFWRNMQKFIGGLFDR